MPVALTDGFEDVAFKLREPILQATNLYVQGHPLRATLTPGGFLVQGRPGTGKSTVVRRVAEESGLPYRVVPCSTLFSSDAGESESALRSAMEDLKSKGDLSLLILEEIDVIAGRSTTASAIDRVETRLLVTLLGMLDERDTDTGSRQARIIVIGVTSHPEVIDSRLVIHGRLGIQVSIPPRTTQQRLSILKSLFSEFPFDKEEERESMLAQVAREAHGFTAADLTRLCNEVALRLLRQGGSREASPGIARLTHSILTEARVMVPPSELASFSSKAPEGSFDELYGLDGPIAELKSTVLLALRRPEIYARYGVKGPRGILVHGPSGTGKSKLCMALANEMGINFVHVKATSIRTMLVGESEKAIAEIFRRARAAAPCILFIDHVDAILSERGKQQSSEGTSDRIVTCFLTEMDGLSSDSSVPGKEIFILSEERGVATNRREVLDRAILRPGRFDQHIHLALPDEEARHAIIRGFATRMPLDLGGDFIERMARLTEGKSGADIEGILQEAAMYRLRMDMSSVKISEEDVKHVMEEAV